MKRRLILTEDGSSSIYIEEMNEHYHSTHGAIQEANHVFIFNGLKRIKKNNVNIFELGFGTGLNAFLTLIHSSDKMISYDTIEAFPVENELLQNLNYVKEIGGEFDSYFQKIHSAKWEIPTEISRFFELHKIQSKIQNYNIKANHYDVIYFDAFGPRAQSEMWNKVILQKMHDALVSGGELITYCAQGQFKRDLKSLGFEVVALPGPPGKREMTVAIKK
ncbi:MAG: tRNA (5-methylaminomethyl-2-thiouridine)(34)-methyltransferase MnmD [Flavobacteriales bacterium]|nr:tRNA (5-methylaminomethyl-2-thiouridine)(34)-methyltransferase MnmD [Flavobacteriales bacterium]